MNIVKGVADLIRRSSSGQSGEYSSSLPSGRFSPPTTTICFSEAGDEAILKALWANYAEAVNEVEKRKLFHIFLKQFLAVFRNWRPINFERPTGQAHYAPPVDSSRRIGDVVVGCYFGHPIEIILTLIEELSRITTLLADNQLSISTGMNMTSESWLVLDALTVVTLSIYNCKVFGYHSGIQKLTALMKAAVVVLRTITSVLSADEILSSKVVDNAGILQKILVYVVSVICNFVDIHPIMDEAVQLESTNLESGSRVGEISPSPSTILKSPHVETILFWHQTTVISLMEAGGLNWLSEIMRVMRRLNVKEQWIDMSLQFLTLRALRSALANNPRGQNHFRSIGGLEVILDGLGVPSVDSLIINSSRPDGSPLQVIFDHHVLSLEVLREAVFGNFNNLQFLYENGRVHKFANSFCSLAFMIQEYIQSNLSVRDNENEFEEKGTSASKVSKAELSHAFLSDPSFLPHWEDYTSRLSASLCHLVLEAKETELFFVQPTISKNSLLVTGVYAELAVKWFTRVLLTVFQCIKACSDKNEMPSHLRIFAYTLQQCALSSFRKVLVSSPSLVDVFRTEGVWDFIFSENFFYFGPAPAEIIGDNWHRSEILLVHKERYGGSSSDDGRGNTNEVEIFQIEVISFVEFAACLSGSSHNLPECAVLLDALEQSACNPELAAVLAKSLLHILQLSAEKTVSSFKALDAIPRILQIACIQAQDSKRPCSASPYVETTNMVMTSGQSHEISYFLESTQNWPNSMKMLMDVFAEYFSASDDAKISILHSYTCINCMFDLFWEEGLRNHMLKYVLDLMKIVAVSEEDQKAKLFLCSKYLETFTHLKDRVRNFADLSIDLLAGMRDMLLEDAVNYQALFREGGCFLHIVSLLNGNLDGENGENLVLNVIQTLTSLLSKNEASKVAFRALVGKGYQTFQSLLLEFCRWQPSDVLLNSLLDMLVDGKFDLKVNYVIKNEDVILLYFSVLQKSSDYLKQHGLGLFLHLLRDSLSNRASCVRAGVLNFLLNWFSQETGETMVWKIAHLIQVIGGHSISGKDIRKIFALLRSDYLGPRQHSSLLLTSMLVMLKEKGPTAFFDLNGIDSGIVIKTPVHWPVNKGFSFTCWLRVESFPQNDAMGLFSFLTEDGRGCYSVLVKDKLIYEAINQKQQCVSMDIKFVEKNWHFLSLVHSVGRAFSSGSQLKCYLDGVLLSSEKCRYAKINEPLTRCTIGTKPVFPMFEENAMHFVKDSRPFLGQIGPTYLFSDAISSEHVQSIYSLGPSYMYYFRDNEISAHANKSSGGVFDSKDALASKIIFGLNAQASDGRALFNVTPTPDHALDKKFFEATVSIGTQLCSRRLLQQIVYCVGGVSVFFPLLTQFDIYDYNGNDGVREMSLTSIRCCLTVETIKLIASIMDDDLSNQQQMFLLSGFSVLGFLLRSVPPKQLNLETLSALKHLFHIVVNDGMSDLLVKDAISCIFLNPYIWVGTVYKVQRELYMFLIQQFDDDPRLLKRVCRLPRVLDIIQQFYSENVEHNLSVGSKLIAHVLIDQVNEEKLSREETRKVRLLLLSLGEMSLREQVTASDIKAFVAFFETCQDMECVEDILNMIMRAVSQKQLLVSFLEQVNLVGGCHIFANLLSRDMEPVRLLGLQFIGRLLVDLPIEKKGPKFFNIAIGRSKSVSEGHKKMSLDMQPIFPIISDRLFNFPQTEILCVTLFDVLLGGASPKQVLQKHNQFDRQSSSKHNSQFVLPQALSLIFRFLSGCEDAPLRMKIMGDLLDLLDSNPSNIEAMMENGWNSWLIASTKLDVIKDYKVKRQIYNEPEMVEQNFVKNVYILVLSYYMHSVKGGWQNLEETADFLIFQTEQGGSSYQSFLCDLYEGLIQQLINLSAEENVFVFQPSRDNTFYLLKLIDEKLVSEIDYWLPFPASSSKFSPNFLDLENSMDFNPVLFETLLGEPAENLSGIPWPLMLPDKNEKTADEWWNIYDNIWIIVRELIGKAPSTMLPRSSSLMGPSLGQRARGLVESLNIPTAEMAAVVSGGISSALVGKPNKSVDKAMLLRGERCSRLVYRLTILYICRSSLERASQCVQRVIPILPFLLTADDEQSKNRLQLFIWALFAVRSQYGMHDDGARFHVICRLLAETINSGKALLATSIMGSDDLSDLGSNLKEGNTVFNFIQKDRLLSAVSDEIKYIKTGTTDQSSRLDELRNRMEESSITDSNQKMAFEDLIQSTVNAIIPSDDSRRSLFQRTLDEEQQIVAEKWIHTFRLLIDERGPWSANPFPSSTDLHWKLDKTEDAWRRRQKLRRNYHFNDKLCHPSSAAPSDAAVPSFNDEKFGFGALTSEKMKKFTLKGIQTITDEGSSDPNENETQSSSGKILEIGNQSEPQYPEVPKESGDKGVLRDRKGSVLLAESENSEVLMSAPCVLVTPKRKLAGRLEIMKNFLHFYGEFLVEGSGGSVLKTYHSSSNLDASKPEQFGGSQKQKYLNLSLHSDPSSERQIANKNISSINGNSKQKGHKSIKRHRWWNISKIKAVHWTRYLLRYTAIEIFFVNSAAPIFFNFASQKESKDIGSLIVATRNEYMFLKGHRDKTEVISFVDRHLAQEMAETARENWRRREITNFEYLMILNTLSGRSYNDLTQYPVLPWIIADYVSESLDLKKSATFRDLSKPVGALDPKRFEVFEDRYCNFSDPDIPSFYYGSHYSSMGIVLFYLLRLEPFTALHRNLQGGKFDHADRLFQSIEGTYKNCLSNTSDVKELIPEFFYMPEFLINSNSYHFGVKQDGEPISDVSLPPWAKGSPEEFINKNREALESEYVSSNLHHWIDLVFGYKQRGKPAVEAANVFYYLTYEGAVNLEDMEDELQKSAIEDQIANFGQTPIQLFRKKHPRRGPPIPISHPLKFAPGSINLTSVISVASNSPSAVLYVNVLDSNVVFVNQNLTMTVKMWLTTQLQSGGNFTFSGSQDPFFGIGAEVLSPCKIGSHLAESIELGPQCFAALQTPSENFLITCGTWENSFQVMTLSDGTMVQSIRHHKDVVSCVAVTADGSMLATGSYDTTVMVWEVLRARGLEKRSRNTESQIPWKNFVIADTPFHILCGHDDIITCIHASAELDLVISGSKDGSCIFHTLREGRYVRSLRHPSGSPLSKLVVSHHGLVVLYADDDLSLHLYSINGRHISSIESNGRLSCLELSKCGEFLVSAGDQGQIVVRSMNSLEILRRYTGIGKLISSLTVTPEECFLAGTRDGSLLVYSIENQQLRKSRDHRNTKYKASVI
ncbi:BEACH domain-containing protein B isoform X2 [Henckelia pumila]|uniref:BEACH domain-containing protein B isoform X2 n=1 Tax=Henckelia pumila TaxID=405737 RepID=UPI003C6E5558